MIVLSWFLVSNILCYRGAMTSVPAKGSRSVLKAFVIFCLVLFAAGFAWAHGGWFALFSFFFLVPGYFFLAAILCGIEQILMKKRPAFVPNDRIRIPFVAIIALLALQNVVTPVLTDSSSSSGYWSIVSGFQQVSERSAAYNFASMYYLSTNLVIIIAFTVFMVLVIKDVLKKSQSSK